MHNPTLLLLIAIAAGALLVAYVVTRETAILEYGFGTLLGAVLATAVYMYTTRVKSPPPYVTPLSDLITSGLYYK